jgi:hypothetical protein
VVATTFKDSLLIHVHRPCKTRKVKWYGGHLPQTPAQTYADEAPVERRNPHVPIASDRERPATTVYD